ncbi:MAG: Acetylornithine deacetylase [Verrucomicrobiaceae bacterium]|nr:Acetylornithine deacetylase [Verrucomicrobiaceae bacterium]
MSSVIETLASLVRLNSVNPAYGDGGTEENVVPFIRDFFARRGIETFTEEVFAGRHNIIARLPGKTSRRIVLEAHMDTVSIKGMSIPPFDPVIKEGRMHGRGSVDDKAGLAAMMHAVASLKQEGITPPCEVWMAAVVDEEFSFRGVVKLCEGLQADASIVAEPTEMRAVIASKGVLRWRIKVHGKAAHSSKPHLGVNAITHMARLVLALEAENANLASRTHPLLGPGTLNVGVINGGVQVNFVPDQCMIEIDQRLLPGESAVAALARCQEIIDGLAQQHPGFEAVIEEPPLLVDEALDTPPDASTVVVAQRVLRELGLNDEPCGVPFGSDASKLSRAGIPTIVFGPGSIDQAHGADEFVPIDEVLTATEFYRRFILSFH